MTVTDAGFAAGSLARSDFGAVLYEPVTSIKDKTTVPGTTDLALPTGTVSCAGSGIVWAVIEDEESPKKTTTEYVQPEIILRLFIVISQVNFAISLFP